MILTSNELYNINGGCFIIVFNKLAKVVYTVVKLLRR